MLKYYVIYKKHLKHIQKHTKTMCLIWGVVVCRIQRRPKGSTNRAHGFLKARGVLKPEGVLRTPKAFLEAP